MISLIIGKDCERSVRLKGAIPADKNLSSRGKWRNTCAYVCTRERRGKPYVSPPPPPSRAVRTIHDPRCGQYRIFLE